MQQITGLTTTDFNQQTGVIIMAGIKILRDTLDTLEEQLTEDAKENDDIITLMDNLKAAITAEERRIVIVLEGGIIQNIEHIPADVTVEVRDFDTEGHEGFTHEIDGAFYIKTEWN